MELSTRVAVQPACTLKIYVNKEGYWMWISLTPSDRNIRHATSKCRDLTQTVQGGKRLYILFHRILTSVYAILTKPRGK